MKNSRMFGLFALAMFVFAASCGFAANGQAVVYEARILKSPNDQATKALLHETWNLKKWINAAIDNVEEELLNAADRESSERFRLNKALQQASRGIEVNIELENSLKTLDEMLRGMNREPTICMMLEEVAAISEGGKKYHDFASIAVSLRLDGWNSDEIDRDLRRLEASLRASALLLEKLAMSLVPSN